ncbi:hypothetical protein [uncultured Sunxiuqinia sp.]|uniref:hypothetical protein n=1 Tax=uncultured Sunxiuqinia sp. TaxID=1573825 RepID=UPI002AA95C79|nr:hypothetical protein [uncultured Sunxiuqinia sp.]
MSEKHIEELIRRDHIGEPSPKVRHRINYIFMLESIRSKVRQNSFGGFFGWVFSLQGLRAKAVVASVLFAFVMIKPELKSTNGTSPLIDSTQVQQNLILDSTLFHTDSKSATDRVL